MPTLALRICAATACVLAHLPGQEPAGGDLPGHEPSLRDEQTAAVEAWYQQALAHERAAEHAEAEALLEQVLLARPEHAGARLARDRVRTQLGTLPAPRAALATGATAQEQLTIIELRLALVDAHRAVAAGQPEQAREAATRARGLLAQGHAPVQQQSLAEVEQLIADLDRATLERREDDARALRETAQERAWRESLLLAQEHHSSQDQQVVRILEQKQRGHYELALGMARRLVSEHPGEQPGETLYAHLLELVHAQRRQDTKERDIWMKKELAERINRSMIPTGLDGSPEYPETWASVQALRRSVWEQRQPAPNDDWRAQIANRLASRHHLKLEAVPVGDACDLLAGLCGVNLVVHPDVRAAATPVSLDVRDMEARSLLDWICRQAGTKYQLRNEAVHVGSPDADPAVLRVYAIEQLIRAPVDLAGPGVQAFSLGEGAGGGGGGFNVFGNGDGEDAGEALSPEDLVDLIRGTIAPESWSLPEYTITIRGNQLFIRTSQPIHDLVQDFLAATARANNQMVFLALKWLSIDDGYLEEIGVDWHNLGGQVLQGPTAAGYTNQQPEWSATASLVNQLPSTAVNLGSDLLRSGMQLHWLHLNALSFPVLTAFLTAQETNRKVRTLEAVEIATLNGVRANCFFGQQIAYISDYDVGGSGNYDPVIDVLMTGQALDIKPLLSADRKYVTLDLQPVVASATFFTESITAVSNQNGGLIISGYPLELPNLLLKSAGTRVTVFDQGTTLVGGFGRSLEQNSSTKIPILGHIPFLGRLFGKRGRYSDRTQIYLTVSARIILHDEEEAKL